MCCAHEWTPEARAVSSGAKRRLQDIQELQVVSVCLGIEHLMNNISKRRRATARAAGGAARVSPQAGQQPRLRHDTARDSACDQHPSHHHRASSCRLCYSTLRVLRIARAHVKRCRHQHEQQEQQHRYQDHIGDRRTTTSSRLPSCEACRMWSLVGARCASMGIIPPGDVFASVGGGDLPGNGVAATAEATAAASSALVDAGPVVRVDTVANE
eukprot:g16160.t1